MKFKDAYGDTLQAFPSGFNPGNFDLRTPDCGVSLTKEAAEELFNELGAFLMQVWVEPGPATAAYFKDGKLRLDAPGIRYRFTPEEVALIQAAIEDHQAAQTVARAIAEAWAEENPAAAAYLRAK